MTSSVILDTTILTNYALVSRSDLVYRLWASSVLTTSAAMHEYQAGVISGKLPACWNELTVVELSPAEGDLADQLPKYLGEGERTCISVAKVSDGLLATDDLAARRIARKLAVPVTGTLGILLACIEEGLLTVKEANHLLARMIAAGYRSPVQKIDDLINSS